MEPSSTSGADWMQRALEVAPGTDQDSSTAGSLETTATPDPDEVELEPGEAERFQAFLAVYATDEIDDEDGLVEDDEMVGPRRVEDLADREPVLSPAQTSFGELAPELLAAEILEVPAPPSAEELERERQELLSGFEEISFDPRPGIADGVPPGLRAATEEDPWAQEGWIAEAPRAAPDPPLSGPTPSSPQDGSDVGGQDEDTSEPIRPRLRPPVRSIREPGTPEPIEAEHDPDGRLRAGRVLAAVTARSVQEDGAMPRRALMAGAAGAVAAVVAGAVLLGGGQDQAPAAQETLTRTVTVAQRPAIATPPAAAPHATKSKIRSASASEPGKARSTAKAHAKPRQRRTHTATTRAVPAASAARPRPAPVVTAAPAPAPRGVATAAQAPAVSPAPAPVAATPSPGSARTYRPGPQRSYFVPGRG